MKVGDVVRVRENWLEGVKELIGMRGTLMEHVNPDLDYTPLWKIEVRLSDGSRGAYYIYETELELSTPKVWSVHCFTCSEPLGLYLHCGLCGEDMCDNRDCWCHCISFLQPELPPISAQYTNANP